jgi:hypothetical protein
VSRVVSVSAGHHSGRGRPEVAVGCWVFEVGGSQAGVDFACVVVRRVVAGGDS